jgi:hypothetical protein
MKQHDHVLLACLVILLGFSPSISGQQEPQYMYEFHYIQSTGTLIALEKQTPITRAKSNMMGYGKSRVVLEIKGKTSPVRLIAGDKMEFVVKGLNYGQNPKDTIALVRLDIKKDTRELVVGKTGVLGIGGGPINNYESGVPYTPVAYGTMSLKIVPDVTLTPGEYAIQSTHSFHVFCFGIDKKD